MTTKRRQYCCINKFKGNKNSFNRVFIALFLCPEIRAPPFLLSKILIRRKGMKKEICKKTKIFSEKVGKSGTLDCVYIIEAENFFSLLKRRIMP